jgi:arylsulfatase A-like enzyme
VLDELDIADKTIVHYSTDNGPHYNTWPDAAATPFRGEKNTNWEGGWRVPCVMRWPGVIRPGSTCRETCAGFDLFPTFVSLAGAAKSMPEGLKLDGVDLSPVLNGGKLPPRTLFWGVKKEIAIRKGPWKLIADKPSAPLPANPGNSRLYNLDQDIGETRDISEAHPELAKKMLKELSAWYRGVNPSPKRKPRLGKP